MTQLAYFSKHEPCKVILSSATPKHEIIELLNMVRIGKESHAPIVEKVVAETMCIQRRRYHPHRTKVEFHQGKIIDQFEQVAQDSQ